jgi:cytochrome b561
MKTLSASEEQTATARPRYDRGVIALHWATALLVVTLFALAEIWSFLPYGAPLSAGMRSLHVSLGILLAAVLVTRIIWRTAIAKPIPPAVTGFQRIAAAAMHLALYVFLTCQIVLGFLYCWAEAPAGFFGLFSIPSPIKIGPVANGWIGFLHYYNAWLIICLAGAHACVALAHHYMLRDNVLHRMLPINK